MKAKILNYLIIINLVYNSLLASYFLSDKLLRHLRALTLDD